MFLSNRQCKRYHLHTYTYIAFTNCQGPKSNVEKLDLEFCITKNILDSVNHLILEFGNHIKFEVSEPFWRLWPSVRHATLDYIFNICSNRLMGYLVFEYVCKDCTRRYSKIKISFWTKKHNLALSAPCAALAKPLLLLSHEAKLRAI